MPLAKGAAATASRKKQTSILTHATKPVAAAQAEERTPASSQAKVAEAVPAPASSADQPDELVHAEAAEAESEAAAGSQEAAPDAGNVYGISTVKEAPADQACAQESQEVRSIKPPVKQEDSQDAAAAAATVAVAADAAAAIAGAKVAFDLDFEDDLCGDISIKGPEEQQQQAQAALAASTASTNKAAAEGVAGGGSALCSGCLAEKCCKGVKFGLKCRSDAAAMKLDAQQNGWYEKYQEAEQRNPDEFRKMLKAYTQESSSLGRGKTAVVRHRAVRGDAIH